MEWLHPRLNIEVEPWNPLVGGGFRIEAEGGKEAKENQPSGALCDLELYGPSLAVATGLAMRSI